MTAQHLDDRGDQKIAIGRLLHQDPDVLLLDEPARGIDVGSKSDIYREISRLAAGGKAVLIVSSYLPELFAVCDRIAVMSRGRLSPARPVAEKFNNPANPEMHRKTTAVELLKQFKRIDAFVAGVGTGGTITGVGEVLKEKMTDVRICAVEPAASPVISGGEPGYHKIQGIGAGFIPAVLNRQILDEIISVSDAEATACTRRLAAEEGLLVGISSGAACCAALKVAKTLGKGHVVVTIFPDKGEHYLSTDLFADKKWTQSSKT